MSEIDRKILRQLSQMAGPACPPIKALGDLIDNKLSPEAKESLELHMQGCPACINRLVELRELSYMQTEGMQPPPALMEAVKSMVRARSSQAPLLIRIKSGLSSIWAPGRAYLPWGIAGAAAAALLVALVLVRSSGRVSLQNGTQVAQRMVAALAPISGASQALNSRVLSALEELPKTLILEETRGATDTAVYKKAAPATVLVITDAGLGSGVVISSAGDILTNYHVIRGAKRMAVVFKPQRAVEIKKDLAYASKPIKVDAEADLALLKVAAPRRLLHPLPFADISKLQVGDDVHAIGHSEGEVWTYTTGTISRIFPKYQWKGKDGTHRATVIQTQTAINPGNSGGPLLNNAAQVIGINSFRIEAEGLNYAIGSDTVEGFLKRPVSGIAEKLANANGQLSRLEPFGDHITGAYMKSRKPPPDVWLVHDNGSDQPLYAVTGSSFRKRLDTVFKGIDPNWKGIVYYFDVNCDGVVDLIGYSPSGGDTIVSYQRPQSSLRLDSLAGELVKAFSDGSIPYRQVRFCH
ncbi:MAG TPA: trypsin-like peptidase domain-containing protein [Candidatus Binataceae bacterium]|jgi:S1-C subfamily serine protease|nr:trypsin-like peptidase domain-containing protein [Candidatus Binataceae bacterium]